MEATSATIASLALSFDANNSIFVFAQKCTFLQSGSHIGNNYVHSGRDANFMPS